MDRGKAMVFWCSREEFFFGKWKGIEIKGAPVRVNSSARLGGS